MQFFLRYAYAPLFWSGFIGLATWQVGYRQASHAWLVALFLGALGLSFLAERRLPYQPRWNRPHTDRLRDVLHASVNESLNALGILALPLLAGVLGFWPVWPQAWPLWLQLLLAIVLADLGITLVHYASHRSALLWRLHAVHHSVQRLYGFNGLMKHPLHLGLEALGGTLPLLLLGVPQTVAALLAFAIGIQLLLQHSNVDMRIGGLRHVFAWAPLHRLHHAPATSTSRCSSASGTACSAPPSIVPTTAWTAPTWASATSLTIPATMPASCSRHSATCHAAGTSHSRRKDWGVQPARRRCGSDRPARIPSRLRTLRDRCAASAKPA